MSEGFFGALGAIGSALINAGSNSAVAGLTLAENRKLQKDAQKWQEKMSNTAHQRQVADLIKSGINPLYTATGGSGASTGTVGANSASKIDAPQIGTDIMNGLQTISGIRNQTNATNADVAVKGMQMEDIKSGITERLFRIEKLKADTDLSRGERHKLDKQVEEIEANIRNLNSLTKLNVTNAQIGTENLEDAKRRADFIRKHPDQAGVATGVGFWTGELGKLFSGSMSIGRK